MGKKRLIIEGKNIFTGQREAVFREYNEFIEQHLKIGYSNSYVHTDGDTLEALLIYKKYKDIRIELLII